MIHAGDKIARPKGMFQHVGVYLGNNRVFHNHPSTGEAIVDMATFAPDGQCQTIWRPDSFLTVASMMTRISQMAQNPQDYCAITNNCEDTASKAISGKSGSAQRTKWIWGSLLLTTAYLVFKKSK